MKSLSKYLILCIVVCLAEPISAEAQTVSSINFQELESIISKNESEVLVLNFWATWCKPCVEELPAFETISQNYSLIDVQVYLISMDFAKELNRVQQYIEKKEIKSKVVLLDEPDYDSWINKVDSSWTGAIPATVLISKKENKKEFYEQKMDIKGLQARIENLLN
ncbi:MAG: redoxin domain-containing protein [Cytophagales bacterium]|nr:redoxin domain-containing protein [Cytophagales bacterium]